MPLNGKDLIKLLKVNGWKLSRVTESHHIMIKGARTLVVPVHGSKSLGKVLELRILKQAGLKK
jgi:predicted RNA binding protein YcfA (HicA-like mRNA interferase family)